MFLAKLVHSTTCVHIRAKVSFAARFCENRNRIIQRFSLGNGSLYTSIYNTFLETIQSVKIDTNLPKSSFSAQKRNLDGPPNLTISKKHCHYLLSNCRDNATSHALAQSIHLCVKCSIQDFSQIRKFHRDYRNF